MEIVEAHFIWAELSIVKARGICSLRVTAISVLVRNDILDILCPINL